MGCSIPVTVTRQVPSQPQKLPPAPYAYSCGTLSDGGILCWNAVSGATGYRVISSWGGNFTVPAGTTRAHLTGVPAGATFHAQVAAINSAGQGPWSNKVWFTVPSQSQPTPTLQPSQPQPSTVVLQYGSTDASTGGYVSILQRGLNRIAQYYGNGCQQIKVDGIFGPETQQAVRCFQSWAGIKVDGIVGPQTWDAIGILTPIEMPWTY